MILAAYAQDISKPLTQSELLNTIDSFATGDPLKKQPLSIGDDKPQKDPAPATKKQKGPTIITAWEATFDQKTHQAVFLKEVVVKDPEFNVNCDKLTAFLKHEEKPAPEKTVGTPPKSPAKPATPRVATPVPKGKDAPESKGGGLEKAIAEADPGSRVYITQEKVEADGSISRNIGKGTRAEYVSSTGDITLTGMPEVQQGINTCVATDESTYMILNREGRMRVVGPHKTVIKETGSR
jgi:lipopolysaccharide export system protein LptA